MAPPHCPAFREPTLRLLRSNLPAPLLLAPTLPGSMDALLAENPGVAMEVRRGEQLPPCALDNDVLIEVGVEGQQFGGQ